MPYYQYKAKDYNGKVIRGVLLSDNEDSLSEALEKMSLFLIKAIEIKKKEKASGKRTKIRRRDVLIFTIHLATSLEAGVPLLTALDDFADATENGRLKKIMRDIVRQVSAGAFFSDAIAKYPRTFSELYVSVVKAGEATGNLDKVLKDLIRFLEWQEELTGQVRQASMYPTIVILMVIGLITLMMSFTIPKIIPVLKEFNVELPMPTKTVITLSNFFENYWYLPLITVIGFVVFYRITYRTEKGRFFWDNLKLRLPVLGNIFRKLALSRFSHYLSVLYRTGIGIIQALSILEKVVVNAVVAKEIRRLREEIMRGESLSSGIKKSKEFPSLVTRMIEVGEETGALDDTLNKVSDYYDREIPAAIRQMFGVLEPMMIIFLGGFVLFIALSIFLPLWSLTGQIGQQIPSY
ncbi:MAG: type II secretion system F family protein [Acidobacteriota bacterium]